MWMPGGYLLFILMTKCPGKPIENFDGEPLLKQDEILKAFEDADMYVSFVCNYYKIKGMV